MNGKIYFEVATSLDYFGDGATASDVEDYTDFAQQYLADNGYDAEIEIVTHYSYRSNDQRELRETIWQAWLRKMQG